MNPNASALRLDIAVEALPFEEEFCYQMGLCLWEETGEEVLNGKLMDV